MRGGDLRDRFEKGPLPAETVARMVSQIGAGLTAVHARGLWHGVLRPSDVLFDVDGSARLAGVGTVHIVDSNVNSFVGHGMFDPSFCWDDIRRFRDHWPRKLLLKGVLRADDAERAVAAGVDGLVLSNHGGRQLDGAISGIEALPEVVRAVGGRASIFVDGGVRRGSDIAKAVALGAEGVLLGRAPVYGLAAGGAAGVSRAIAILADEFDRTLALTGCRNVGDLGVDLIAAPRA
jgi:isopentenyl diphosphate isomerase/L-lactate dehydrogenase-like FMN-dependent dehydrogenase